MKGIRSSAGARKKAGTAPQQESAKARIGQVDILKGLAAVSVILIHTFSAKVLALTGAPYHIWQAVPVFLLLAGFTGAYAYRRLPAGMLAGLYDPTLFSRRLLRILIPFALVWAFQIIMIVCFMSGAARDFSAYLVGIPADGTGLVLSFLQGAYGPGSYFIPVILQQILLLPVFSYLAARSPDRMILLVFAADLLLEAAATVLGVAPAVYSVLYIRYMVAGALGVWLAVRTERPYGWIALGALFSLCYITAVFYFGFRIWILSPAWSFFHAFSYFWTLALVLAGLALLPALPASLPVKVLSESGKASWHIFLVQMTYFLFLPNFGDWIDVPLKAGIGDPHLLFASQLVSYSAINLAVCIPLGYGFSLINGKLTAALRDWLHVSV